MASLVPATRGNVTMYYKPTRQGYLKHKTTKWGVSKKLYYVLYENGDLRSFRKMGDQSHISILTPYSNLQCVGGKLVFEVEGEEVVLTGSDVQSWFDEMQPFSASVDSSQGAKKRSSIRSSTRPLSDDPYDEIEVLFETFANGDNLISEREWVSLCNKLRINLSDGELMRVFKEMDEDGSGTLDKHECMRGIRQYQFLKCVVVAYRADMKSTFEVDENYDYSKPTNENYLLTDLKFKGPFKDIRKNRDYSYHTNYTLTRQSWQDDVVKSVVTRTHPQTEPWLVYTCGPMGAGKGYALSWMSENGFFPLEHIVHVDPDYFKSRMPEFEGYLEKGHQAGTMCHAESGFIAEIAQEEAMRGRQHVWVDGSLRDGEWYCKVFDDIHVRFPEYRLAIIYVSASESVVRQRIAKRAKETGRDVPEDLILDSLNAPDRSIGLLTSKVDFVARINNDGTTPILSAFEMIDRSGNFSMLQQQFSTHHAPPNRFPQSLAPISLQRCSLQPSEFTVVPKKNLAHSLLVNTRNTGVREVTKVIKGDADATLVLRATPPQRVLLGAKSRQSLVVPTEAHSVSWVHPAVLSLGSVHSLLRMKNIDAQNPDVALLINGGFVYFDKDGKVLACNSVIGFVIDQTHNLKSQDCTVLRFGPPEPISRSVTKALNRRNRVQACTWDRLRDCPAKFGWVGDAEHLGRAKLTRFGGFAFTFGGKLSKHINVVFPVTAD